MPSGLSNRVQKWCQNSVTTSDHMLSTPKVIQNWSKSWSKSGDTFLMTWTWVTLPYGAPIVYLGVPFSSVNPPQNVHARARARIKPYLKSIDFGGHFWKSCFGPCFGPSPDTKYRGFWPLEGGQKLLVEARKVWYNVHNYSRCESSAEMGTKRVSTGSGYCATQFRALARIQGPVRGLNPR